MITWIVFWAVVASAILAISAQTLASPVPIPGYGTLRIGLSNAFIVPLGTFSPTGLLTHTLALPVGFPIVDLGSQALIGSRLSNLNVIPVR